MVLIVSVPELTYLTLQLVFKKMENMVSNSFYFCSTYFVISEREIL